jgi:DNA-3-methyladenine glycosylase I
MSNLDLTLPRCIWAGKDPVYIAYHDDEWGTPLHDERRLFEMLILEGHQAGLSWITILRRRDGYRQAFDNFDPEIIAKYDAAKIAQLLEDTRIIRNGAKIRAAVQNAQAYLKLIEEVGSLDHYLWQFVDGTPIVNHYTNWKEVPAETDISRKMSNELRRRGFAFVGPTICYAYMQSCGLVDDHTLDCYKRAK